MRDITEEEIEKEYIVYKNLSPDKQYRTYLAMKEHSDGSLFAVVLKEMDEKRASVYDALSCMWNPYVADTYEVLRVSDPTDPSIFKYIAVTEYVYAKECPDEECLSLADFVRRQGSVNEKTALSVCVQICEGLAEFHKKGFVHRDIKPDNIMISEYDLSEPKIKIIDFGGAKHMNMYNISDTTVIGTLGYQAPESISSYTTNKADMYSVGCILNYLLTGQDPGMMQYKGNHYIMSIIEKAANQDPYHRYSNVTAMRKALSHELREVFPDNVPVLREIPGYRTHTLWKETVAGFSYASMTFIAVLCVSMFGLRGLAEIFGFYIIIPLIVIFNMGNLLRFFPVGIRKNNHLFTIIRAVIIIVSIIGPIVTDYITGGT